MTLARWIEIMDWPTAACVIALLFFTTLVTTTLINRNKP